MGPKCMEELRTNTIPRNRFDECRFEDRVLSAQSGNCTYSTMYNRNCDTIRNDFVK